MTTRKEMKIDKLTLLARAEKAGVPVHPGLRTPHSSGE